MNRRPVGAGVLFGVLHPRGWRPWLLTTAPSGQTDSVPFVKPGSYLRPVPNAAEPQPKRI
jgi:hypothetical protein